MRKFCVLSISLVTGFYLGVIDSYAQSGGKVIGEITITVDGRSPAIPVIRNPIVPYYENIITSESFDYVCTLTLVASAVEKKNEALVIFHMATAYGKEDSSFNRKILLKRGETKAFKLKPNLKCLSNKYLSVTAKYETENYL